ncbi:MAG: HAD family hydrolase [Alphaproteobacteria bacterium]|nr:HAD family hydrolase [Alphaproteobacteria bacterium]
MLAESVSVKGNAFVALYKEERSDIQKQVLDYHLAHGGVSRFDKIRYFEETLLERSVTEEHVLKIADHFSELVEERVVQSPWVAGAKAFLEEYQEHLPLFVASATPQEELERIVNARSMTQYFKAVFGSPIKKAEHLKTIAKTYNFDPAYILMVGDTISDYKAAQSAGTCFIGRLENSSLSPFPSGTKLIPDLTYLKKHISF